MGGFAAALGGLGNAVQQYGQQMRPILEQRREGLANLLMQRAQEEPDPTMRSQYLQGASDLFAGKDMGKIFPPLIKAHAQYMQNTAAIGQPIADAVAAAPKTPAPPTVPTGVPGGNSLQLLPQDQLPPPPGPPGGLTMPENTPFSQLMQQAVPSASQPADNPIDGGAKIQAQPTPAGTVVPGASPTGTLASLPSVQDIYSKYSSLPEYQTPAGRAFLQPFITQELSHNEAFRQQAELRQMDLGERQQALAELKTSPEWANIPDIQKAQYNLWAHSTTALVPTLAAGLMRPVNTPGLVNLASVPPEERVTEDGEPINAVTNPFGRQHRDLLTGKIYYTTSPGPMTTVAGANGLENAPRVAGPIQTSGGGAAQPASTMTPRVTGVDAQGHQIIQSPWSITQGLAPVTGAGQAPGFIPTTTSNSSLTDASGQRTATTVTKKGGATPAMAPLTPTPTTAPGHPAVQGATPVPPGPNGPAVTTILPKQVTVAPFNPSNRVDSLIEQIANGDTTLAKAATNTNDKFNIETRMAQLGLTPANITTSMRERATNARNILKEMDRIDGIINQADKDGDLGLVATRWNNFLTNTLGKDPTKTQVFSKLSSDLGFLSTAVSMAHGGLRGGSSPTMVEHWEHALEAKDPQTLRSKLGEARKWMEQYAQLDQGLKNNPANGQITAVPGAVSDPAGLRAFVKTK